MDLQYIKDKLSLLPMQPGCYLMKDKDGTVIYVGKAKKLKNRVSSYFAGSHNYKTTKLVQESIYPINKRKTPTIENRSKR